MAEIIARDDILLANPPSCPQCCSPQVQIMDKRQPAQWRCRMCREEFVFEPAIQ